jgi:hypothetical protein
MKNDKIYENGLQYLLGQMKEGREILMRNGYSGKFGNYGPLLKGKMVENKWNKFVRKFEIDGYEFHVWNTEKMYMGFDFKVSEPIWSEEVYFQPSK